jgi:molecular chaperone Hsp33
VLHIDAETVLHRLFWDRAAGFQPLVGADGPRFACTCSRGRRHAEVARARRDRRHRRRAGRVEIACDFCGTKYHFDVVDVGELFTAAHRQPPSPGGVH